MTGKRRRKIKLLSETIKKIVRASSPDQEEQWTIVKLPTELLEMIISQLNLKDNIRASAVCKRWLAVATSVRVADKPPLLMFFPKVGNFFDFYDPSSRKTYCLEMPELEGTRLCYAKYGWLLLFHLRTHRIFFFSPYTRESIQLPNLQVTNQVVFSAPPKSPDCILLTIMQASPRGIMVCTCRPGASNWTTVNYQNCLPFVCSMWTQLCFCNCRFYCLSTGWLGVYDPVKRAWFIHSAAPPIMNHLLIKTWWKGIFMAEHEGNIFVIYTCTANPIVYQLDQTRRIWMKVGNLGGSTIFANFLSSHCRMDLLGDMRNSIYFSKILHFGKRCVSYSLSNERYYPRKQEDYDWGEQDLFESVWMEPPVDLSVFL